MFKCLRCEEPISKPREATEGLVLTCGRCGTAHRVRLSIEANLRIFRYGLVPAGASVEQPLPPPALPVADSR